MNTKRTSSLETSQKEREAHGQQRLHELTTVKVNQVIYSSFPISPSSFKAMA